MNEISYDVYDIKRHITFYYFEIFYLAFTYGYVYWELDKTSYKGISLKSIFVSTVAIIIKYSVIGKTNLLMAIVILLFLGFMVVLTVTILNCYSKQSKRNDCFSSHYLGFIIFSSYIAIPQKQNWFELNRLKLARLNLEAVALLPQISYRKSINLKINEVTIYMYMLLIFYAYNSLLFFVDIYQNYNLSHSEYYIDKIGEIIMKSYGSIIPLLLCCYYQYLNSNRNDETMRSVQFHSGEEEDEVTML